MLDEIISGYQRIVELLELEKKGIRSCFQGELADIYSEMLDKEVELLRKKLRELHINSNY